MPPSEARELKQLRDENARLKRLVADLSLDKVMLQDVVQKSSEACQATRSDAVLDGPIHGQRATRLLGGPRDAIVGLLPESEGSVDGCGRTHTASSSTSAAGASRRTMPRSKR
jgi:hypothetical protein